MKSGTRPHVFDNRDRALHKTFPHFGAISGNLPLMDYTYDAGLFMQNQEANDPRFTPNLPPIPFGCTGETSTDICSDEDRVAYDPQYTYDSTCTMEGHGTDQGCDIRSSMKSLTVYGLRKDGETPEQASTRKRGAYYTIDQIPGRDWFDSFRLALRGNKRSISCGTPWFPEWGFGRVNYTGILGVPTYTGIPGNYAWHDYKICGEKTLPDGSPALRIKSWQGPLYGDSGWVYASREVFNRAFDIYGTFAATPGHTIDPQDIQYVEATLYQQVIIYLNRILALLGKQVPNYA